MTRLCVDQDIAPLSEVRDGLPEDWTIETGLPGTVEDLIPAIADADVVAVTSRVPITEAVLDATALDVVGKLGTGIDNVDLPAAEAADVPVVYTPGYNALSVAELALGLLLGTARRFTESRRLIESGGWRDEVTLGTRISGSTVGIVGMGDVGTRFASLLGGFDVEILFSDPYVRPIDGEVVHAEATSLGDLLDRSDVVCCMPELTDETRGLIGAPELDRMADDAILVNTSRGPVVDHDALVDALADESLGGAGLDVFATEPLPSSSPLLEFDNVVVTPHTGAMTHADREKTIRRLTRNLRAVVDDRLIDEEFLATSRR